MDFLFDIGNVIVHVDFISSLKRLMPDNIDQPEGRLRELLERKDEFEAGRISTDEYYPWAAQTIGFTGDHETFMRSWVHVFSPNTPMLEVIEKLHEAKHRLFLFSNTNEAHIDFLRNHYPVFACFNGGIYSYQTGHVKPEREIYQLAIDEYDLNPAQTAYIDDLPANIEGGKLAGFQCHEYHADAHSDFLNWLGELGQGGCML